MDRGWIDRSIHVKEYLMVVRVSYRKAAERDIGADRMHDRHTAMQVVCATTALNLDRRVCGLASVIELAIPECLYG